MKNKKKISKIIATILFCILMMPAFVLSAETYKVARIWPVLQQPWYFSSPKGLAVDSKGFVYVTDSYGHCVQKFTSDGYFVTRWGTYGTGDGEFNEPMQIAIDPKNEFLHVVEREGNRVQKFTLDGKFVTKWGRKGDADGEFDTPRNSRRMSRWTRMAMFMWRTCSILVFRNSIRTVRFRSAGEDSVPNLANSSWRSC